ncbi:hypothetical protein C4D07_RS16830 [Vibrio parahaemolyticus]|uniref:hypothetical protein n=1 Tax=Vibrio antiquarius (strain Ex25) TaxID=150340 RepID=UPI0026599C90|nr:hypothetical protein [Vibrio antiquarius]EJG0325226.1 hypothetical protein [Vibrio parahaemolyticus]MCR9845813.1 hypothetical protein [Vibrio antiquarius]MCR9911290.1 hypothetical protein [Vibrio antiquarius]
MDYNKHSITDLINSIPLESIRLETPDFEFASQGQSLSTSSVAPNLPETINFTPISEITPDTPIKRYSFSPTVNIESTGIDAGGITNVAASLKNSAIELSVGKGSPSAEEHVLKHTEPAEEKHIKTKEELPEQKAASPDQPATIERHVENESVPKQDEEKPNNRKKTTPPSKENGREQDSVQNKESKKVDQYNQNINTNRNSYGLFNLNHNGSKAQGGPSFLTSSYNKLKGEQPGLKQINSVIDRSRDLQQSYLDLKGLIAEGAPASTLKKAEKNFEKIASDLNKSVSKVQKGLDNLGPNAIDQLGKAVGQDKLSQCKKSLETATKLLSGENVQEVGMQTSKIVQKAAENMHKTVENITNTINTTINMLGLGRG